MQRVQPGLLILGLDRPLDGCVALGAGCWRWGYGAELVDWRARFDAWKPRFDAWDGASVLEPPPKPPKTTKWQTHDAVLVSQRKASYAAADDECGAAHALWAAKNKQRKKEVKKRGRPDDHAALATEHRNQTAALLERHADRELKRRESAQHAPADTEIAAAEDHLQYPAFFKKRRFSAKALAAARQNLEAANLALEVRSCLDDLI